MYVLLSMDFYVLICRIDASDDDIRRAYRRMLLFHHPDKRKPKGEIIDTENDYFTCITRAYEVLGKILLNSLNVYILIDID